MERKKERKTGFTLIELLIAITIIGVLVSVGLGSFGSAQKKARDAKRKTDLESIARALELYYNDFGSYPIVESGTGRILGCGTTAVPASCSWGGVFSKDGIQYMVELPDDPNGDYWYVSGGTSYQLYARLENTSDGAVPHSGATVQAYTGTVCRSGTLEKCNYGIRSSNTSVQGIVGADD